MSFLVLLQGGVRRWQVLGHAAPGTVVGEIRVPGSAVFSAQEAAVFASKEEAEAAVVTTEGYHRALARAGQLGADPIPGVEYLVVEVPG